MSKSLLEQLPSIVTAGKRQAAQILEQLEGRNRVTLQTRELVIPSKDSVKLDLFRQPSTTEVSGSKPSCLRRQLAGDSCTASRG